MGFISSNKKVVLGIGGVLGALGLFYVFYRLNPEQTFYFTLLWIGMVSALLFLGNRLIAKVLDRKFSWLKYGTYRFVLHLTLGILYSLVIINLAYLLFKYLLTTEPPIISQLVVTNVYGIGIFIPLFSIYFSLYFLRHWRVSIVATEKAQKENLKAQLTSLKDHLDPHFLFNNLNILSSLIEIDTDRSQQFLGKFAEVYRAILLAKDEDLITLDEELKFMESYIFLIKTRFREDINFTIAVSDDFKHYMLPPLSIQMLVENAVKHNKITEQKPLTMEILSAESGYLIVKNNLNKQVLTDAESSGSGLNNLKGRYAPFSDQEVKVMEDGECFEVSIPLIAAENI